MSEFSVWMFMFGFLACWVVIVVAKMILETSIIKSQREVPSKESLLKKSVAESHKRRFSYKGYLCYNGRDGGVLLLKTMPKPEESSAWRRHDRLFDLCNKTGFARKVRVIVEEL